MKEEIVNLTDTFNAAVKKGGLFQLDFPEGGISGETWDVTVTSGKATAISDTHPNRSFGFNEKVFRADEAGPDGTIELVATGMSSVMKSELFGKRIFKIRVK